MSAKEPLTLALAEAVSRYVGASKVGTRRGSATAVAKAMTERGVPTSSNTLARKMAGDYPMNTDEIAALAAVIGVDPDEIWAEALRIMRATPVRDTTDVELLEGMSRGARLAFERERRKGRPSDAEDPSDAATEGVRRAG